ncbi:type IV pilin N-terminal domain-containing protein [Methanolacinia paynteri]|uniref:type IV pilin N-terminal domain-containing protein n=1 Tax=Methanolacinia paynteri TaxID=230356 RepID=UPI000A045720|nr:type IV pilin N-terminal domain-containing protein [Methanolacinia paynteri]
MKFCRDHLSGLSEVFGVMLMLTITLIIACVVAAFACGHSFDTVDDSISANIVASDWGKDGSLYYIIFDHLSGDPVDLNSIEINLANRSSAKDKTVISNNDVPRDSGHEYIENYGEDDTTVTVGDRFRLYADGSDEDGGAVTAIYWQKDGADAEFSVPVDGYIDYRIIDLRSGRAISAGSIPVEI